MTHSLSSMTGYGEVQVQMGELKVLCRVKSVNSRSLEMKVRLPKQDLYSFEKAVKDSIQKTFKRGSFDFTFAIEDSSAKEAKEGEELNHILLNTYIKHVAELQKTHPSFSISECVSLLKLPGVLDYDVSSRSQKAEELIKAKEKEIFKLCIEPTLQSLKQERLKEGTSLKIYFEKLLLELKAELKTIEKLFEEEKNKTRESLTKRAEETLKLLHSISKESGDFSTRLRDEIIFYLEKGDVSEEISRLHHHFQSFDALLKSDSKDGIGRKLEFLQQEMHREVNTLGSKLSTEKTTSHIITMKTHLDRIREQAANVE